MITDLNKLSNLEKIAKVWQLQLNLEYCNNNTSNTRLSFKDIGAFCELLATKYNDGFVGCGSGGMGLDLVNYKTRKAVEVKSCCTIQNAVCKNCGTKFNNLFLNKCPKCSHSDYKIMKDSRFGIDAKEFLSQYEEGLFENFTMCYISLVEQNINKKTLTIKLEWFIVDFKDDEIRNIQLEYFENQYNKGRKPHCNLLPYSYDFYKLCPQKIDDKNIIIDYSDINITPVINECSFKPNLRVPINIIPEEYKAKFRQLNSFSRNDQRADVKDFTVHLPYKVKSLGKERGDTRGKVYNAIR